MDDERLTEYVVQYLLKDDDGDDYWSDHQFYDTEEEAVKRYLYLDKTVEHLTLRVIKRVTIDTVVTV